MIEKKTTELENAEKQIKALKEQNNYQREEINKVMELSQHQLNCLICTEVTTTGVACNGCHNFHCSECEKRRQKMNEPYGPVKCFFCKSSDQFHVVRF